MNTHPAVTFEEHVSNLLDWLRSRVPTIDAMPLRFFDRRDLELKQGRWMLPAAALKDTDAVRVLFEQLCQEGREWINLSGDGATPQGQYLISVEYSKDTDRPVTFVNLAGPPLDANGNMTQLSEVQIALSSAE